MAIEKVLNTRLQMKYDSYTNWTNTSGEYNGANFILKSGEIGICYLPTNSNESQVVGSQPPQILFKVGNGTSKFSELPWASAKAADVYAWAKQAALPVTKEGNGNVVASITWDETTKGIKFTTASVATSEGMEQLANRVTEIEKDYITDNGLAEAVRVINEAIALKADKTYVDEELNKKVNGSDFNTFKTENTTAISTAKSEAIAAAKTETETQVGALREGAVKTNTEAIAGIKNHASINSFADVMSEIAKKQDSGDYATQTALAQEVERAMAAEKANADAITRLTEGVSQEEIDGVNDLIEYVNTHGPEVTQIRHDITQNTREIGNLDKALTTEIERATNAETTINNSLKNYYTKTEADAEFMNSGEVDAKISALDLANTYEAKGAAATAKSEAIAHANGLAVNYATAAQGSKADSALQEIEATANSGLKIINKNQIDFDEEVVFVFNCGTSINKATVT